MLPTWKSARRSRQAKAFLTLCLTVRGLAGHKDRQHHRGGWTLIHTPQGGHHGRDRKHRRNQFSPALETSIYSIPCRELFAVVLWLLRGDQVHVGNENRSWSTPTSSTLLGAGGSTMSRCCCGEELTSCIGMRCVSVSAPVPVCLWSNSIRMISNGKGSEMCQVEGGVP